MIKVHAKTLIIRRRDIERLVDMRQALRIAEETFRYHGVGRVQMPPKIYLHLDRFHGDFRAMPAYIDATGSCGIKWVNVHPDNRLHNLPSVMAVIILSSPETGLPLAVMDGTHITNLRTGASGGVAAKYLANRDSSSIGLVGCGVQAKNQLLALKEQFPIKSVSVYDSDKIRSDHFIKNNAIRGVRFEVCASVSGCVRGKDIVVTTTPSRKPIVKAEWISPGTHINAIGADAKGKEELESLLFRKAKIFVDDVVQASHSGEINVPIAKGVMRSSDICATLGEVIAGIKKGRLSRKEITIFDSTGLAIQDMALAGYVYSQLKKGLARKRIRKIDLIN
jgi:alanine dehydrogenase